MKSVALLILVFCSLHAQAQSSWDVEGAAPLEGTPTPTYENQQQESFAADENPWSVIEEASAPRESKRKKPVETRRAPRPQPRPLVRRSEPKPAPKPVAAAPAPRQVTPPPRLNVDPAVFRSTSPTVTQATSGAIELPYNLRIENYDFKRMRVKPNPAFRTPTNLRSPILASVGYYDDEADEPACTDPLLCAARAYNASLSEQARRLNQVSSYNFEAMNSGNGLMSTMDVREGKALPYAALLASNFRKGYNERRRKPMCAKAVRRILEASKMIPKDSPLRPEGAKDYRKFLENFGFRHNPKACNSPGVVRVYDKSSIPQCSRKRKNNCFRGRKSKGDIYGHVEILGTDGQYHHFTKSKRSIQEIYSPARRPLIGCMVKESGSR